jgi:AcrR family transcriptional regulator
VLATAPRTRGALTADAIVAAGLRIARAEDLERLTMKRLAEELGVTPMAVYRYFRNKAELVDAILDRFVQEAAVTRDAGDPADWQTWLRRTFGAMHRALVETPGVLTYLGNARRFGTGAFQTLDETLGVLLGAGFGGREAVEAYMALTSYTIGAAGMEAAWRGRRDVDDQGADERRTRARIELTSAERFPHAAALAPHLAHLTVEPPFAYGFERLLESLALRL